ncbi:hypothetical protein EDD16DRAFT_1523451 [Pisolithus croceorrhizus]|nr:hypothetical protein EDD16DRAFT_1523451 [Pisolithus croceorrhizus]
MTLRLEVIESLSDIIRAKSHIKPIQLCQVHHHSSVYDRVKSLAADWLWIQTCDGEHKNHAAKAAGFCPLSMTNFHCEHSLAFMLIPCSDCSATPHLGIQCKSSGNIEKNHQFDAKQPTKTTALIEFMKACYAMQAGKEHVLADPAQILWTSLPTEHATSNPFLQYPQSLYSIYYPVTAVSPKDSGLSNPSPHVDIDCSA